MRADRAAAGLTAAGVLVALAFAPAGFSAGTWLLLASAVLVVLGTFAPALPVLHVLPLVGAPHVLLGLTSFDAEAHPREDGASTVFKVLRVVVENRGPGTLRIPRLNILVPSPIGIVASDVWGHRQPEGRGDHMAAPGESIMHGYESRGWNERLYDLEAEQVMLHYLLICPYSGVWTARVTLASSSLYRRHNLVQQVDLEVDREGWFSPAQTERDDPANDT